jgi:hypothetical protein
MKNYLKFMLILCIALVVCVLSVFADTYHQGKSFTIADSSIQSSSLNWTPAFDIPAGNLYMKTYANLANPTGQTEYYTVSPKASAPTVGRIKIDGNLYTKTSNTGLTGGITYGAKAYKWDSTLTIEVTGKIYFYSTNNS